MKPTHEIFDSLKVVIPGPNPFLVRVCVDILFSGIEELDNILFAVNIKEILVA